MKRLAILLALFWLTATAAMACGFDGSGNYTRCYNWQEDKANGIKVVADRMDTEMDTMAQGLSTCLLKDGTQQVTNDIGFSNFRLKNVGAATALTDACQAKQVQNNAFSWADDSGSANAYSASPSPSPGAYAEGQVFWVKVANSNTTSATLNISSLGTKPIKKGGTTDVGLGDLQANAVYPFYYDGTNFQIPGALPGAVQPSIVSGTTSVATGGSGISATVGGAQIATIVSTGLNVTGTVVATTISATTVSATTLKGNGSNITGINFGYGHIVKFDGSGTFLPGFTGILQAEAWGGGAGGGGTSGGASSAAGGGGGYCKDFLSVTQGVTLTITVGTGGTGGTSSGTAGSAGGITSIVGAATNISATGGTGGGGSTGVGTNAVGGVGGTCGTGSIAVAGGDGDGGGTASGGTPANAGRGGAAGGGGGPGGARGTTGANNASNAGGNGVLPGGGGAAAGLSSNAGGNGAGGRVTLTYQ